MTALQDNVNETAPMKDIRANGNSKPWFDSNIMEAIRVRDTLGEKCLDRIFLYSARTQQNTDQK